MFLITQLVNVGMANMSYMSPNIHTQHKHINCIVYKLESAHSNVTVCVKFTCYTECMSHTVNIIFFHNALKHVKTQTMYN